MSITAQGGAKTSTIKSLIQRGYELTNEFKGPQLTGNDIVELMDSEPDSIAREGGRAMLLFYTYSYELGNDYYGIILRTAVNDPNDWEYLLR